MAWLTFGTAVSPEPMSALDQQFSNVASGMSLPCTASGSNVISLTPLTNFPALTSYAELGGYRFTAVANSTGAVTLQYNGLGLLPVYKADGITQASIGDILLGEQYIVTFHQALNGGGGGFFLENPSVPVSIASPQFSPGGRLTFQSGVPVMFTTQSAPQTVFYAPYLHPFAPIYNGSTVQMYQFTSGLSDQIGLSLAMAGSGSWPINTNFDVFVILNPSPVLATVAWTNQTTRATTLSIFAGFLTNSGSVSMRTGAATTVTVPANQGTFLGTFATGGTAGQSAYIFGGAASGGTAAQLLLCNYYNKILQATAVTDNGASYTYSSATIRQARASAGMQIQFIQSDSEKAAAFSYRSMIQLVGSGGGSSNYGIGVNTTTAFADYAGMNGTAGFRFGANAVYAFSFTGLVTVSANEQSDGTNATNFDINSDGLFKGSIWL